MVEVPTLDHIAKDGFVDEVHVGCLVQPETGNVLSTVVRNDASLSVEDVDRKAVLGDRRDADRDEINVAVKILTAVTPAHEIAPRLIRSLPSAIASVPNDHLLLLFPVIPCHAVRRQTRTEEELVAGDAGVGLNNEAVTLSGVEGDLMYIDWSDGGVIDLDDLQHVTVDRDTVHGVASHVDNTEPSLAQGNRHRSRLGLPTWTGRVGLSADGLTNAVDETRVGGADHGAVPEPEIRSDAVQDVVRLVSHPVLKVNHALFVVVSAFLVRFVWGMHNEATGDSVGLTVPRVGVPPVGSHLGVQRELVRVALASSDGALRDTGNAVHVRGVVLSHAVPVDRLGSTVVKLVVDVNNDLVSSVGLDKRAREQTIDGGDAS